MNSYVATASSIDFSVLQTTNQQLQVVEWCWSGTKSDEEIYAVHSYLVALVDGKLTYVDNIPIKLEFKGRANKFKGFLYMQVMKLGVPLRNLFKNLNFDLKEV